MIPTVGRIVHYRLDANDVAAVKNQRAHSSIETGSGRYPQKHGNPLAAGDVYPMLITRVWGDTESSCVQGQVFLDGNDTIWKTSVQQQGHTYDPSLTEGVWFAPPRH